MTAEPLITLLIDATITLKVEVWPDGDAPDEITADAVKAVLESCGDLQRVLHDWNLEREIETRVHVASQNPHWANSPPLPEFATVERFVTTRATVWDR